MGHTHQARKATVVLSDEQIATFREKGYVSIPQIAPPDEVAGLRDIFDRLFDQKAGRTEGAQFDMVSHDEDGDVQSLPAIINPVNYAPELRHIQFRVNALAIARQLLGSTVTQSFEQAILKPAWQGAATPWHQDEAARTDPNFDYNQISFWMPLQEATVENGCMHFIAGSHKGGILPHRSPGDDPKIPAIECAGGFNPDEAIPCPMAAGGASVHHGKTLHYAGPNQTAIPRRAYILAFEVPPEPSAEKRDFYWNAAKQTAFIARQRRWRRSGGILIEIGRKARMGVWRSPGRIVFEARRAFRALTKRR
jgi:ectoine hydroxylase-related dioxygenase (phytanoyl-CoA dioxygenase family)